jgi:hypothetical protein
MNRPIPKFNVLTGEQTQSNPFLAKGPDTSHPLKKQAGAKLLPAFQTAYCEKVIKKHFPKTNCSSAEPLKWSMIQSNDQVKNLTQTWLESPSYTLNDLPTEGKITHDAWSDDYWRTRWGLTAYRYGLSQFSPMNYEEAVNSFNPVSELASLKGLNPKEVTERTIFWSPAEKYDLTVGDSQFNLTQQQKNEGKKYLNNEGDVESWMGLCHGWAPAALMVNRPQKPVTVKDSQENDVIWYPNDIKAMITLAWAQGTLKNNFVGGRCNTKNAETFSNGRLKQQECFDNNPATFHLALGNMLGREHVGFVYDKSFDYEVWNQPIIAYETTYFDPLNPTRRSKNWQNVAVEYSSKFKKNDRFQSPLTRGKTRWILRKYDDSKIKYVVGAITTVVYLAEIRPEHTPESQEDRAFRETYTYDLELEEAQGQLVASGGEWHENNHPDFLWVVQKGKIPVTRFDNNALSIDFTHSPSKMLTETAKLSSQHGNPLCRLIKELIFQSTGSDTYNCP